MRRRAKVYRQNFRIGASYRSYESSAARGLWFRDEFLRTRTRAGTADGADSRTASTDVFGVEPATLTLDGTWVIRVPLLGPLERFYGVADDVAVAGRLLEPLTPVRGRHLRRAGRQEGPRRG